MANSDCLSVEIFSDGETSSLSIIRRVFQEKYGFSTSDNARPSNNIRYLRDRSVHSSAIPLLVRCASPDNLFPLKKMVFSGQKYCYLIDDNFWLLEGGGELSNYYRHPLVRQSLEFSVRHAEVVFCFTEVFARFLRHFNDNVVILPLYFDFSVLENKKINAQRQDVFKIGIVGNSSRSKDIDWLVPVVLKVIENCGSKVCFEFFGYIPKDLLGIESVVFVPATNTYEEFIKEKIARGWKLGLSPLEDSAFARFKTNNKFREFSACGIPTIFSDVPVYRESVENDKTGWLLPKEPAAWIDKICYFVKNPSVLSFFSNEVAKCALERYSLDKVAAIWFDEFLKINERLKRKSRTPLWPFFYNDSAAGIIKAPEVILSKGNMIKSIIRSVGHGFLKRYVISVAPNESICTYITSPIAGRFYWAASVATFGDRLSGLLQLRLFENGIETDSHLYDLCEISDGGYLGFQSNTFEGAKVHVVLENYGDKSIGFYGLSEMSTTLFKNKRTEMPLGIFV